MSYRTLDLFPASIQHWGGQEKQPLVELPPNPLYRKVLHYLLFTGTMMLYSSWAGPLWLETLSMLALICLPLSLLSRDASNHSRTLQACGNEDGVHSHFACTRWPALGFEQLIHRQDTRMIDLYGIEGTRQYDIMTRLPEPLPDLKALPSKHCPSACFSRGIHKLQTRCKGFDVAFRGYT